MKAKLAAGGTVLLWASAFPAIAVADRGLGPAGLAVWIMSFMASSGPGSGDCVVPRLG